MPFYEEKKEQLLNQLNDLIEGNRVPVIEIGYLTPEQHELINENRATLGYPKLESPEILYLGRHHVESRHKKDHYTAEDILAQIIHILTVDVDIPASDRQTKLISKVPRIDAYGNTIIDNGILELMSRKPKAELYSVIPKGDFIKPNQQNVAMQNVVIQKKAS